MKAALNKLSIDKAALTKPTKNNHKSITSATSKKSTIMADAEQDIQSGTENFTLVPELDSRQFDLMICETGNGLFENSNELD